MVNSNELKDDLDKVDKQTNELIMEFQSHYEKYIEFRPEDTDRKDEIFQSWVIQKISGIQVSILELAERVNLLTKTSHSH